MDLSAHKYTLEYVNLPLQTCSTNVGHIGRYQHNQFAEEQGHLNHLWLSFEEKLNSQVRRMNHSQCITFPPTSGVTRRSITAVV